MARASRTQDRGHHQERSAGATIHSQRRAARDNPNIPAGSLPFQIGIDAEGASGAIHFDKTDCQFLTVIASELTAFFPVTSIA